MFHLLICQNEDIMNVNGVLSLSFMFLQMGHLTHGGSAAVTRSTFTGADLCRAFRNVHVALSATAPTPNTTATVMPTRSSGKAHII